MIPGQSFWLKPKEYFDDSCYIILMEGFMSNGKRGAADVAQSNGESIFSNLIIFTRSNEYKKISFTFFFRHHLDWTTHCANKLHKHANENKRDDCTVIVINWGFLSCKNYFCLVARVIRPLGEKLGELFVRHFNPQHLYLFGHSLGGKQIDDIMKKFRCI